MVLNNYVTFTEGVPKQLHFIDHAMLDRPLKDPLTGLNKMVTALTFTVDQEDGLNVSSSLSITSENFSAQLAGYVVDRQYVNYNYIITRRGSGFSTRYTVQAVPR